LGYVHERYAKYYKGIKVEHSNILVHYLNDKLYGINGSYAAAPNIDIAVAISKDAAIKKQWNILAPKNISGKTKSRANG